MMPAQQCLGTRIATGGKIQYRLIGETELASVLQCVTHVAKQPEAARMRAIMDLVVRCDQASAGTGIVGGVEQSAQYVARAHCICLKRVGANDRVGGNRNAGTGDGVV
jgi:hypothetical protein